MEEHATDRGVFLRSMASRGHLGGLAAATAQAVRVLEAAGCDVVLVETVGVGQSEVEIAGLADTCVVLLAPGLGDGIQAAKAGLLEIGDLFVVNKADRDGADATVRDLRHMIQMADRTRHGAWRPPVLRASALDGTGVPELASQLSAHREWLESSGDLAARRRERVRAEVLALAIGRLRAVLEGALAERVGAVEDILDARTDPFTVADSLVNHVRRAPDP